jgi:predicted XRE-type DNA-binding protein
MHKDIHDILRRFVARTGMGQAALAEAAGVSQPSVSRALRRRPSRWGRAHEKLFQYIKAQGQPLGKKRGKGDERVAAAFKAIWDGSEAHASVVMRLISDLEGMEVSPRLRRRLERKAGGGS